MALTKTGGGLRPIAVGGVWRRLAAKVGVHHALTRAAHILSPRQVGVGVGGGCEAASRAARQYLKNIPSDGVIVKLDFKNAFNSVRRDSVLEAVASHFPELLPFAISSYSADSDLFFGEYVIPSCEGVQQGDPLGPLFFSLAVHRILQDIRSEFVVGYLDDVSIEGGVGG